MSAQVIAALILQSIGAGALGVMLGAIATGDVRAAELGALVFAGAAELARNLPFRGMAPSSPRPKVRP